MQGVHEGLSGWADAGRFTGAASEHHLHVGTRLGPGGGERQGGGGGDGADYGRAETRRGDCRRTKEAKDVTCDHAAMVPNQA